MTERFAVMEGTMDDIDLSGVLQVVGIGRQYTGVEFRAGNEPVGTVFIKAGKVVKAITPVSSGRQALFELFERPPTFFHVYRTQTPSSLPEPLGTVGGLVAEATRRLRATAAHSSSSVRSTRASAPPLRRGVAPQKPPSVGSSSPPSVSSAAPASGRSPARPSRRTSPAPALRDSQRVALAPIRPLQVHTVNSDLGATLAIASPKGGCGKTTIALNLAISLAKQNHRVILVDTDINGDVLSWINAREKAKHGAYDALLGLADVEESLLPTILPELHILPAAGNRLPTPAELSADHSESWQGLLTRLRSRAEIVLVDTPAGMYGTTHQVLGACSHVLGVLQAEAVAQRSFSMFQQGIDFLKGKKPAKVAGVVLNMLNARDSQSLSVFQRACAELPQPWLLETSIPRSDAFLDASGNGLPVRLMDDTSPPAMSWLFDTLAAEVVRRIGLSAPARSRPKSLLM